MDDIHPAARESRDVAGGEMQAMRGQGATVERAGAGEALDGVCIARVFRNVDVKAGGERAAGLDAASERPVAERESGVEAEGGGDHAVIGAVADALDEADVFPKAVVRRACAIAVGGLVAEDAAQSDLAERLFDAVQATGAGIRTGVMIDQRADPTLGGVDQADQGAVIDVVRVQGAIETPPEFLQDRGKVLRRLTGERDSARERAVEMRVAVDEGGHQQATARVDDFFAGRGGRGRAGHGADRAIRPDLRRVAEFRTRLRESNVSTRALVRITGALRRCGFRRGLRRRTRRARSM